MDRYDTLERFLSIESGNRIPSTQIEGIELWPVVRTALLFSLMQLDGPAKPPRRLLDKISTYSSLGATTASSLGAFATLRHRRCDAVALSPSTLRRCKVGARYADATYDYYGLIVPNLLIIEEPYDLSHKAPRYSQNIMDLDWAIVRGRILSQVSFRSRSLARDFLKDVEELFTEDGLGGCRYQSLSDRRVVESISKGTYIASAISLLQPKIVFMDAASYGGYKAIVCKICKEMGIATAEAQHGVANMYHPAYNYGAGYECRFGDYLPDYFLTYGGYWTEELRRLPSRKITIGYPYLGEYLADSDGGSMGSNHGESDCSRAVLVISQPTVAEQILQAAVELDKRLPDNYRIVYKLHPMDRLRGPDRQLLDRARRISVASDCDIYDLLAACDVVVGGYSTVLFEAIAFGRPVIALDTPIARRYLPAKWIEFVSSADQLVDIVIESEQYHTSMPSTQHMWELEWRSNLARFLGTIGMHCNTA